MEQTTNVFNKGLQTDTHPMVQGNDTLSDALNATLVTMNGNEVVLQNDMGNAKIDNAYLPPGYQPVGMKEYGGIIYVAAYNPITNKSQIGSFPSPERKISVEDKDLGNTINLDTDFSFNELEGINFLDNDILLIPLTSDTSLHVGDKFTVYSSYIWQNKNNITNFNNTINDVISNLRKLYEAEEDPWKKGLIRSRIYSILHIYSWDNSNKVYSPKNKKYTLSLGILNSQNEFVDITKSLVRWKDIDGKRPTKKENESDNEYKERLETYKEQIKPIEFTNESDLIKFNTGYFIAKDFVDPLEKYIGNDKELIAERQKMAVNSYAYKLIGPLYLKAELNHIKNFDFSIEGTKIPSENNKAEILIKATITYNCPDGIDTMSGEGDNNYFDYFFGKLKDESIFPGFHLYKKSGETYEREYTTTETEEQYDKYHNTPKTKYNPETNLYEVTIEKKYTISPTSDNKYEYYVCIPSGYKDKDDESENYDDVYIKGLSTKGEIDFDKLGSGTLEINEWRFYNTMPTENNSGKTILTYGFNSYPRIGHTFSDMKISFVDDISFVDNPKKIYSFDTDILNRENIEINWNNGFEKNKLYRAIISYKDNGEEKTIENEWLLTTTLFNDCYYLNSNNFIKNYVIFNFKYNLQDGDPRLEIKNKLLNLDIDVNDGIKVITKSDYNSYAPKLFGDTDETLPDRFTVKNNYTYNISCINPTLTIKNIDLYPDYVNLDNYNNIKGVAKWNDFTSEVTTIEDSNIETITFNSINNLKINFTIKFKNVPENSLHWEFFENTSSTGKSGVIENPVQNQNIGIEYQIKENCTYRLECWIDPNQDSKTTIKIYSNIALTNKLNVVNYGDPNIGVTKDVYVTTKQTQNSPILLFNRTYSIPFYKLQFQIDQKFLGTYTKKQITIDHLFQSFLSVFDEANSTQSNSNSPFNIKTPMFTLQGYNEWNCDGESPRIVLIMVKNENNFNPVDAQIDKNTGTRENQIGENLIWRRCHDGDEINIYNYSQYQNQISETLDSIHSDSQFVVGISKKIDNYYNPDHPNPDPYRAGNRLNSYDQNKPQKENSSSYVLTIWTKSINGWSVIIQQNYYSVPELDDVLELLKSAVFTSNGWENFHTDFKIDQQKKQFNVLNTYSYIDSYDFETPLNYKLEIYIDGNIVNEYSRQKKFNKGDDYPEFSLELYNTINNNAELEFKSNSNFDNAIIEGIEISQSDEIDCYDEDLKIQYDINGNKLKYGVKYKKVNLGLTKNFNEANNIQEYSIVENVRTFSLPYVNSTLNTWYFWSLGNDDDDKEGLSVIGLKMDSQLKYFS